jgi:predicted negative regulator of RcsB-dependent stress response
MTRKELKQPDQFITATGQVLGWIRDHTRYLLYGVLGVVVIIGLILGWSSWQRQRQQRAAVLLQQAIKLVETASEADRVANTSKAIEQLQALTQHYGSTPSGAQAYWYLGHLHFDRGDMAAALTAYEQARQRLPRKQQIHSALATLNIGYAQAAAGACDEAISSFEAVRQSPVTWLYGEAYLGIGRCHERNGAPDQAIAIYDQALADTHVTATVQQAINERLTQLQPAVTQPEPKKINTPSSDSR